jgi:hypothetical protein
MANSFPTHTLSTNAHQTATVEVLGTFAQAALRSPHSPALGTRCLR